MLTNSAAAKINNQLIQVQELFTSDFENPLKEKIKEYLMLILTLS
jgi:hypothetical protein